MIRFFLAFAIFLIIPAFALASSADVKLLRQARSQVKIVTGELQQKITADVRAKGAENVFSSCRLRFDGLTDRLSDQSGWVIRRTSLQVRNRQNEPDTWELEVLELFASRQLEGIDLQTFEFAKLLSVDGRRVFRYMKPIVVQDSCLPCHGGKLSRAVSEKLAEQYPDDLAVGFESGDLRGAFSLIKFLPGELP